MKYLLPTAHHAPFTNVSWGGRGGVKSGVSFGKSGFPGESDSWLPHVHDDE